MSAAGINTPGMKNDYRARNHPAYWAFIVHRLSGLLLTLFLPLHFWALGQAFHGAAGLLHQRADHADRGRLARPVGSQQREEITLRHVQIDALQRGEAVGVGLAELADGQGIAHRGA